uniref:FYVE-type domain-containing protein n=1 Tax=Peronospora matthiolae TaxID=2874970 RepID=A0AAV1US07_9STRA
MVAALVSDQERLDLIEQSGDVFAKTQEWLENAKASRTSPETKDNLITSLETFTVYGSLDAVTDLYLKDDMKMALDFSKSRELAVLRSPTKQRPLDRVSLRWSLLHSPSQFFAIAQDFCYLEVTMPFETTDGRRGWARCLHSVKHKACPTFRKSCGSDVHRAELLYSGLFFEETRELGVLKATVCYNIKRDHVTPAMVQRLLKTQSKRTVELLNHYRKMSTMMLKSRKVSLTRALQLHAERRCGACANQLSKWKPKERCSLCRSLICDKCNDIVALNYRVDRVSQGRVACFACAHRHGTLTAMVTKTRSIDREAKRDGSTSADTTCERMKAYQEDGLQDDSISLLSNEETVQSRWCDGNGNLMLAIAPNGSSQQHPEQLNQRQPKLFCDSSFLARETLYLPKDHATSQQRRRCTTRVSSRRPVDRLDEDLIARGRRRTTGNSRLSTVAKPTAYESSRHKVSPAGQQSKSSTHVNFTWFVDQGLQAATRWNSVDGACQYDSYRQSSSKSFLLSSQVVLHHQRAQVIRDDLRRGPRRQDSCDFFSMANFK